MGYSQVYKESGIPKIGGNFQTSKECADNRHKLLVGMMYWAKTNGIKIDTDVFFVNMTIKEMVKKVSTQEARWKCMKVHKV